MKVLGVKQIKRLLPHTVQLRRLVLRGDFENEDRYIASNPIPLTGTDVFVITKGPQAVAVESNKAKADEWVVNSTYTQSLTCIEPRSWRRPCLWSLRWMEKSCFSLPILRRHCTQSNNEYSQPTRWIIGTSSSHSLAGTIRTPLPSRQSLTSCRR